MRGHGNKFVLEPLETEPFYHGYGTQCKDKKVTVATRNLQMTHLLGQKAAIQFHMVKGDDPLLLGNNVISVSTLVGAENLLLIPKNVVAPVNISLPTYTIWRVQLSSDYAPCRTGTKLPLQDASLFINLCFRRSLPHQTGSGPRRRGKQSKAARVIAVKLHTFTHLTAKDMNIICSRAGGLDPFLFQALELVVQKCTSRKRSGRPPHSSKFSFARVLSGFNDHLQVDFLFISELQSLLILYIEDV